MSTKNNSAKSFIESLIKGPPTFGKMLFSLVADKHLSGLKALAEEGIVKKFYLVSNDKVSKKIAIGANINIHLMPWTLFLEQLWADDI